LPPMVTVVSENSPQQLAAHLEADPVIERPPFFGLATPRLTDARGRPPGRAASVPVRVGPHHRGLAVLPARACGDVPGGRGWDGPAGDRGRNRHSPRQGGDVCGAAAGERSLAPEDRIALDVEGPEDDPALIVVNLAL